jgi:hypothetical protein
LLSAPVDLEEIDLPNDLFKASPNGRLPQRPPVKFAS